MQLLGKRGKIDLSQAAMMFVFVSIVIGIGAQILATIQASQTSGTVAYNATGFGLTSLATLGEWLGTIALVIAAGVVLGYLIYSFAFKR